MFIPSGFWKAAVFFSSATLFCLTLLVTGFWQQLPDAQRVLVNRLIAENTGYTLLLLLLLSGSWLGGLFWVYRWWVKPVHAMADELLLILSVNPSYRINTRSNKGLSSLAKLINEGADRYQSLEKTNEDRLSTNLQSLNHERNTLSAVLTSLSEGLVLCTTSATIIFINTRGREFLDTSFAPPDKGSGATKELSFLGPGRCLTECLTMIPLESILTDIARRFDKGCKRQGQQVTAIGPNGHFLAIDIAPLTLKKDLLAGYVVKLNPVSSSPESGNGQIAHVSGSTPWCESNISSVDCSKGCLTKKLIPTELTTLIQEVIARLPLKYEVILDLDPQMEQLTIDADPTCLVPAISRLLEKTADSYTANTFTVHIRDEGELTRCDFLFPGERKHPVPLTQCLAETPDFRSPSLSIGTILQLHTIRLSAEPGHPPMNQGRLRFTFTGSSVTGRPNLNPVHLSDGSPLFSDFDLYKRSEYDKDLESELLSNLTYTVFDLETTGLDPLTDEIISIGAVRCAHGKMMPDKPFSLLIDPGRDIPEESQQIHGLDQQVLNGQPTIDTALPTFHRYAENTILVGHNVAFDMRMLEMKRYVSPLRFTQPVLDTMHLAAIIHPFHRNHSLEAISRRLGVRITGRHTAVGDAMAAAEILNKCLPLLARANILTLGDALQASQKTRYSRMVY